MKKIISIIIISALLMSALIIPVSAASYPIVFLSITDERNTGAIPYGETGTLVFQISREFNNEKLHVEIYDSSNTKIASSTSNYYSSSGLFITQSITLDTVKLDMGVGEYTVKYWMEFYSLYQWNTCPNVYTEKIKIIENKCNGNHDMQLLYNVTVGTCQKKGCDKYACSKCGYYMFTHSLGEHTFGTWQYSNSTSHKQVCSACSYAQTANHKWDNGKITKDATCSSTGIKTYTCTICNGTKTETISKNNNHTYGNHINVDSNSHKQICTKCNNIKTEKHNWNAGTITIAPTVTSEGLKTFNCINCDASYTQTLPPCIIGDINEDTRITDADAVYLLYHTFLPAQYPINQACDFNKDGEINDKDAIYLLYHTFLPEKYPIS